MTNEVENTARLIAIATKAVSAVAPISDVNLDKHDDLLLYEFVIDVDVSVVGRAEYAMTDALANEAHCKEENLIYFSCATKR